MILTFLRSLTPRGMMALAGIVLVAIICGLLLWNAWSARATAKAETRLATNQTTAALESGADAVATVGQTQSRADAIDIITEENERAIRQAPGADAPVDSGVHDAGLRSLCRRAAYRGRAECLQFAPAR